jgi:hypothetical protein
MTGSPAPYMTSNRSGVVASSKALLLCTRPRAGRRAAVGLALAMQRAGVMFLFTCAWPPLLVRDLVIAGVPGLLSWLDAWARKSIHPR